MLPNFEFDSVLKISRWKSPACRLALPWGMCVVIAICGVCESAAQSLNERLVAESQAALATEARRDGDPVRGAAVFYARALACSTCHSVGDRPPAIGPDLAKIDPKTTDVAIVEAILEPSKTIAPAYATLSLEMTDGRVFNGLLLEETNEQLILRDAARPEQLLTLKKSEIESRTAASVSIMPTGQINRLANRQQFLDLVRYLIELREGGPRRARELQPAPDPLTQKVPDEPLPYRPVVQRGEVAVEGNIKYPRAVALGFAAGTVLFDADQLRTVAWWPDGFVKSSPQHYFGLYWHRDGGPAEMLAPTTYSLSFQLPGQSEWRLFESPTLSDPNVGTRFEGYQVGRMAIRLHYRLLVGQRRIQVTEDVRAESRPEWQGLIRSFRFTDLPAGSRVAVSLPGEKDVQCYTAAGEMIAATEGLRLAPLRGDLSGGTHRIIRGDAGHGAAWLPFDETASSAARLVSAVATANEPVVLRVDSWNYRGRHTEPTAAERATLVKNVPQLDDSFDLPRQPLTRLPVVDAQDKPSAPLVPTRAAVDPKENIDEFPPTRGRWLRFVVTGTTGNAEPGLDELEVYGPGSDQNLALRGKATASSVIAGYPIHQIPHLNDGKLGNNHSWISAEKSGGWAQIEFPDPVEMNRIVWARDRTGVCRDRLATAYRIEISSDGKNWSTVGSEAGRSDAAIGAIRRDASPGYVMEAIPAPFPTWRPADVAFDGETIYAIAMTEGQIWRTRVPPTGQPERVSWLRFATGLYHPTGLAIVDGRLFVAQKPEITELIDRNGDGICDEYRTVATGWGLSTGWHEYCFGLAVDPQKNLWFALNTGYFWTNPGYVNPGRWRGSILRVSHETEQLEVMATGCRVPNGIAQGPDGEIFFTDNQGDWIQSCKLAHVVPGRFYGHPETKNDALPKDQFPDGRSTVWMPYALSRSTSGPAHDRTQGKFGPFANQLFVGDVGYGANPGIMRIALEKIDGEYQGACFRFVDGQPLGCERLKFGPDGQLYMASLSTGLTRMAFDGHTPWAIQSVQLRPHGEGFVVKLTRPLTSSVDITPAQFRVKRYHYLYTGNYGSPQAEEQSLAVTAVQISPDRTEIKLAVPVETYPIGMVYEINLGKLTDSEGETLMHNEAWYTVHKIPK